MKPVYLVHVDCPDAEVFRRIQHEIARYGDRTQAFDGTWLIATRLTAQQLYDRLSPVLTATSGLLVVKITREVSAQVNAESSVWLHDRYAPNAEREAMVRSV